MATHLQKKNSKKIFDLFYKVVLQKKILGKNFRHFPEGPLYIKVSPFKKKSRKNFWNYIPVDLSEDANESVYRCNTRKMSESERFAHMLTIWDSKRGIQQHILNGMTQDLSDTAHQTLMEHMAHIKCQKCQRLEQRAL